MRVGGIHMSRVKNHPCDLGDCPFGAHGGMDCYNYCGLGADEDSGREYDEPTFEDVYNSQEIVVDRDDPTDIRSIPLLWR